MSTNGTMNGASEPPHPILASSGSQGRLSMSTVDVARQELQALIAEKSCGPILLRLAWHDAGTMDARSKEPWPKPGGANGSIRFKAEQGHGANAGIDIALRLLEPIKAKVPDMSWADLFQLAGAVAVHAAGGPFIPLRLGREDAASEEDCTPNGRLPSGAAPYQDGAKTAAEHLRNVFYRMGLTDRDIVALSGAHAIGRVHPERSGFGKAQTVYTKNGPGTPGGQSWTVDWQKFDNSYFQDIQEQRDSELVVLPTDAALFEDPDFRIWAERYAASQDAFFSDYVASHLKLSELGAKWQEGGPITLEP